MKNKILIVIFILLFILFIWTVSSSAYTVTHDGVDYDFGDIDSELLKYTVICTVFDNDANPDDFDGFYILTCDKEPFIKSRGVNDTYYNKFSYSLVCPANYTRFFYSIENNEVSRIGLGANSGIWYDCSGVRNSAISSNFDIKDTDGNVVFPSPVQQDRVAVELEKVEELPNLVGNLLRILIPVGLTVFSAVLLIYLIKSRRWLHF